jgi:hypothetical protein
MFVYNIELFYYKGELVYESFNHFIRLDLVNKDYNKEDSAKNFYYIKDVEIQKI